ncbi:MAG TPA: MMPL family transporter [Saprospiraceae bacterium]|nr:MMPL family transporter [Saprospiraceae bacterium]HRK80106.1 MMPL family transporter [Saprospiraceae bacterium]
MERIATFRKVMVVAAFALLGGLSVYYGTKVRFSFDFEQFFPEGDEELAFFRTFVKDFESDENFMLIAVRREDGVFEQEFLEKVHDLTLKAGHLPYVVESQSLTKWGYPIITPFIITTIPAIHRDDPDHYAEDKARILADERFVYNFITPDARTLTVALKMMDYIPLKESREFMRALDKLMKQYEFEEYHYLGRPYFQRELVAMQQREILVSALISGLLVALLLWLLLRRFWGVFISLISIALSMLLFVGFLGVTGRELSMLSALYPLLMIIVSTSDVVHILSKYQDELLKGYDRKTAITTTIKEIGLATFMTSATTAVGFLSLFTSRIVPIREFGVNAAVGVMLAFVTVIVFTTTLLTWFDANQISRLGKGQENWNKLLNRIYLFTVQKQRSIVWGTLVVIAVSIAGISMVTTNYDIVNNLPRGKKITEDFLFFEREMAGFRPVEFAVFVQKGYQADDYAVLRQLDTVEQYLRSFPDIHAVNSITTVYKSIHRMKANNDPAAYRLPPDEEQHESYRRLASKIPKSGADILISKDGTKARITSRVKDCGADSIKRIYNQIDQYIASHTDPNVVKFRRTGTGIIIDKNAAYVRSSLFQGLLMSILIIGGLMGLIFKNLRMLLISMVPNVIPLLIAGALMGFFDIELEAGVSIIFTVVFGIAVDDSIHFLSRYRLLMGKGIPREQAIHATMMETGKPIVQTTILLFFGFLVLLFSISPPSVAIGIIISATLFSALVIDLLLLPLLLRKWG